MNAARTAALTAALPAVNMVVINAVGYLAAICTTVAYVPQLLRVLHLRSARDLSYPMLLLLSFGLAMWFLYGVWVQSAPLLFSNGITLALSLSILGFKIYFDGLHRRRKDSQ